MAGTLDHGGGGRCLCGAVRYAFDGPPKWQAHCHCESCRRCCSAPFTSFFCVKDGHWRWTAVLPDAYASSPGVKRHFCGGCGTPMAFEGTAFPGELHFYAASLDDPTAFAPRLHVHWDERLPWVCINDGLPVHRSPRRLGPDDDPAPVLTLIRDAFAAMEGRIDPPSSMHRLTGPAILEQASVGEVWTLNEPSGPIACLFLTRNRTSFISASWPWRSRFANKVWRGNWWDWQRHAPTRSACPRWSC